MSEVKTVIGITGVLKFATLERAEPHPDYPDRGARFRIEMNTPQANASELKPLKQAIAYVGRTVWTGAEATKRMRAVQRTIDEGDGTQSGMIGLLNGNEYKPEYNEGAYVIRASAKETQRPVFRRWDEAKGKYVLSNDPPKPGDLVKASIEVWAMKQHSRINFTLKAIQVQRGGEAFAPVTGGAPVTETLLEETLTDTPEDVRALFAPLTAKAIEAGENGHGYDDEGETVDDEDDTIPEDVEEPAPPPKKQARETAPKKGRPAKAKAAPKVVEPEVLDPEDEEADEEEEEEGAGGLFDGL